MLTSPFFYGIIIVGQNILTRGDMMKLVELFKQRTGKTGFYNIMPIENLESVMERGILSNESAKGIKHSSVAMAEIQEKRDLVMVPNGRALHEYANLYFDPRNPMMFKRRYDDICVLKISPDILYTPGAVVTDQNASSKYAQFNEPADGLSVLNCKLVYAEDWTDDDHFAYLKKKSYKCAEVLIPDRVPPEFIEAVAVKNIHDMERVTTLVHSNIIVCVRPKLFFM